MPIVHFGFNIFFMILLFLLPFIGLVVGLLIVYKLYKKDVQEYDRRNKFKD